MSDNATLMERLSGGYITEPEWQMELNREAAARIAELEAETVKYEGLLREQAAEISRPFLARIAELEADAEKVAVNELRKLNLVINQREAQRIRIAELEAELRHCLSVCEFGEAEIAIDCTKV